MVASLSDGPIDAATLADGLSAEGSAADRPAWTFDLADPSPIVVTARSVEGDPLIRLRDEAGAILGENDDADGLNSRIDVATPLAPGRYCIEVEDLREGASPIAVALTALDPVAERRRRIDALEIAPVSTDAVEVTDLGAARHGADRRGRARRRGALVRVRHARRGPRRA